MSRQPLRFEIMTIKPLHVISPDAFMALAYPQLPEQMSPQKNLGGEASGF